MLVVSRLARHARTALGVLTILVILGLTVLDAATTADAVRNGRLLILLALAGSLLGFDILLDQLPIEITVDDRRDDGNGERPERFKNK